MGMFDSLIDAEGNEWQTKALGRALSVWRIGEKIPTEVPDFQVKCMAEIEGEFVDSLATIRDCKLAAVPSERDATLPLVGYDGNVLDTGEVR